jgi:hypothetical protein
LGEEPSYSCLLTVLTVLLRSLQRKLSLVFYQHPVQGGKKRETSVGSNTLSDNV